MGKSWKKWLLGTLGALVLGAIGSGLWDWAFAPIFSWIGRSILTVVTLGIEAARDSVYESAALGFHELPSLLLLQFWGLLVLALPFFLYMRFASLSARYSAPTQKQPLINRIPIHRVPIRWLLAALLVASTIGEIQTLMRVESQRAITHYEHTARIIAPYISEVQQLQFDSQFAQVRTKKEYDELLASMEKIGEPHKLRFQKPDLW